MTNDTDIGEEINVWLLGEELWLTSETLMTRLCFKFESIGSISYSDQIGPRLLKIKPQLKINNSKIWKRFSTRSAAD
jgi:hypothetical protein